MRYTVVDSCCLGDCLWREASYGKGTWATPEEAINDLSRRNKEGLKEGRLILVEIERITLLTTTIKITKILDWWKL